MSAMSSVEYSLLAFLLRNRAAVGAKSKLRLERDFFRSQISNSISSSTLAIPLYSSRERADSIDSLDSSNSNFPKFPFLLQI